MPKEWEHHWIEVNKKTRYCAKCSIIQNLHKTTMGTINIRLSNATWEPKVQKKCGGKPNG